MIKKMNAQKGMLGLGLLKIVAQVSLFLVLLLTSSSSFALFCGLHVDADARITSSVHSHGEADHQDVSNSENHQSDDDDCHLTWKSHEVVFTNFEKVSKIPSAVPVYPTSRFDEKKIARIRDYIPEYTVFRLRGTVILNS